MAYIVWPLIGIVIAVVEGAGPRRRPFRPDSQIILRYAVGRPRPHHASRGCPRDHLPIREPSATARRSRCRPEVRARVAMYGRDGSGCGRGRLRAYRMIMFSAVTGPPRSR